MRRMHVIDSFDRMGGEVYYREEKFMHNPELREAYECGVKEGRKEAYKEIMEEQYGERRHMGRDNIAYRDRWRDEPPMMRENKWREPEDDEIEYRRRRRANGQYM